jgi:hypothetical protein
LRPGSPNPTGAPIQIPLAQSNLVGARAVGLPPGVGEAQKAEAEFGQEAARGLQNAANEVPTQRMQLDLMLNDLRTGKVADKTGPSAEYEKTANVIANRVLGFHPTMSKEEIAALDSFSKVGRQIALSQAGALHATDQTLTTTLGANPNISLSGLSNEGIISMLHGNADAIATKAREWNKARSAGVGPDKFFQWSDQFNQSFDPRVFHYMRMTPTQRKTLLANIPDRDAFKLNLLDHDQRGFISLPKDLRAALMADRARAAAPALPAAHGHAIGPRKVWAWRHGQR